MSGYDGKSLSERKVEAKRTIGKLIYNWGNEPCPHNLNTSEEILDDDGNVTGERPYPRRKCDKCWEELNGDVK